MRIAGGTAKRITKRIINFILLFGASLHSASACKFLLGPIRQR